IKDRLARTGPARIPAVIDDQPVAKPPERHGWGERRWAGRIGLRAEIADRPERELSQRAGAEPAGRLPGREGAENARVGAPAMAERQEQQFELKCGSVGAGSRPAGDDADGFAGD